MQAKTTPPGRRMRVRIFYRFSTVRAKPSASEGSRRSGNGESGGAGLAGLQACAGEASSRETLGLDRNSVALVFNTEGATDGALYESLLMADPQ